MVYLIHFHKPLKHARHYLGFCATDDSLDKRLTDHLCGMGARLLEVLFEVGIEWSCVRVWYGADRKFERKLKDAKHGGRFCPVCNPRSAMRSANQFPNGRLKGA